MTNRDLAEKIYEDLNKRGADLGNASIGIIRKTLDDNGVKNCSIPLVSNSVRQEIERRRDLIISEPEGVVRETMISNLAIDL